MDIFHEQLNQEFQACRDHTYLIKEDIILLYYARVKDFEDDRDKFFETEGEKLERFYSLDYPFKGHKVFEREVFKNLVDIVPEFIVSLVKRKMPYILTLREYQEYKHSLPVLLSSANLKESSQIIYNSWNLLLKYSSENDPQHYGRLIQLLQLFQTSKPHYDLLGLFQNLFNSLIIMGISQGLEEFEKFQPVVHTNHLKRDVLFSIAGRELTSIRILNSITEEQSAENLHETILFRLNQDGYPRLNSPSQYFIREGGGSNIKIDSEDRNETDELTPGEYSLSSKLARLEKPFITRNKKTLSKLKKLQPVIDSKIKVLIRGETGTGKDVLANAIHTLSKRTGPLKAINCAGISSSLFESEIFGHEKGAFTGASEQKKGAFELADQGTLFLDEIGDLPLDQQAKLLRAVETNSFSRVGGQDEIDVNVRIISATNLDLEEKVKTNSFREDLLSRLSEFETTLTPLNDRADDIPLLSKVLFERSAKIEGVVTPSWLSADIFNPLSEKCWSRNVRQLDNHIHRIVAIYKHTTQTLKDLQSLINDDEVDIDADVETIFTGNNDSRIFDLFIEKGCSINAVWKKAGVSKDTATKIIYGIMVRLLAQKGSIKASIDYLANQLIVHKDNTQPLKDSFENFIDSIKIKVSEKKSMARQLYKPDQMTLVDFLKKE